VSANWLPGSCNACFVKPLMPLGSTERLPSIHCGTASPPISWNKASTSVSSKTCSGTARYARVALNTIRQIQSPLGWCGKLSPFIRTDRAVFAVEYTDTGIGFSAFCNRANELNCRRC
jgi:hypothetical protein